MQSKNPVMASSNDLHNTKELMKLLNRLERILVPSNSLVENIYAGSFEILASKIKKGVYFRDFVCGRSSTRIIEWDMLEPAIYHTISSKKEEANKKIVDEIETEKRLQSEKLEKLIKFYKISSFQVGYIFLYSLLVLLLNHISLPFLGAK
jgi:hypothetical protein